MPYLFSPSVIFASSGGDYPGAAEAVGNVILIALLVLLVIILVGGGLIIVSLIRDRWD